GLAGVIFAAKTSYINPMSFTIWESITILCVVVIGGMGSAIGVIAGALVLILLPEYLRAVAEYRMLVFGALQVIVMVFKPEGLIEAVRKTYKYEKIEE
ncbi:MAG: branched-chain amino acid ABC transporter permease, partial [Desulfobacteraceae bacterium]|nr:branched-chain amino acid ABC transporter permease [Desulfobacteraceae bacterium]